jgi:hypothetical protein
VTELRLVLGATGIEAPERCSIARSGAEIAWAVSEVSLPDTERLAAAFAVFDDAGFAVVLTHKIWDVPWGQRIE